MTSQSDSNKKLNIALWSVQILLALTFAMAGITKLTTPTLELANQMSWVHHFPRWMPNLIGDAEIAGALGLILPSAFRVLPILTPLAAAGLFGVMLSAAGFHIAVGEYGILPVNFVLGGLSAFVLWGRLKKAPIAPRA
jgi:putative oxidoreductase